MRTRIAGGCLFRTFRPQLAKAIKQQKPLISQGFLNFSSFMDEKMAPQVGLEPTTLSVRNIVVLLAWGASQYSVFLPAQSNVFSRTASTLL